MWTSPLYSDSHRSALFAFCFLPPASCVLPSTSCILYTYLRHVAAKLYTPRKPPALLTLALAADIPPSVPARHPAQAGLDRRPLWTRRHHSDCRLPVRHATRQSGRRYHLRRSLRPVPHRLDRNLGCL